MKTWVYIAGPYSSGDVVRNTQQAVKYAEQVYDLGFFPYVPHLCHLWHLISPHDYDFWLAFDMHALARCDVLLRIPGVSSGAEKEVNFAEKSEIPVIRAGSDNSWIQELVKVTARNAV